MQINEVITFIACRESMAGGELALVSRTDGSNSVTRIDDMCPAHGTDQCLEVYLARRHVAGWSLRHFWTWRGFSRRASSARERSA